MKIKTIKFKRKNNFSSEQENEIKNMIIIISLFAAGMIIGAGIMRKGSSSELITNFSSIFDIFASNRNTTGTFQIFLNSLIVNLIFIFAVFFAGLSCIGIPLAVAVPIIKGIGLGMLSGYLFTSYAMNGIGYYLLTVFPAGVLSVTVLLLASCSAGIMSKDLLAIILEKRQPDSSSAVTYIKRYAMFFAGTVIASLVETISIKAFAYLFTF